MNNYKSKEIDIKNRTCCYFDGIININDLDLENFLINKKHENFLVYEIAYRTLYSAYVLFLMKKTGILEYKIKPDI